MTLATAEPLQDITDGLARGQAQGAGSRTGAKTGGFGKLWYGVTYTITSNTTRAPILSNDSTEQPLHAIQFP